jgi:hypothetical protein
MYRSGSRGASWLSIQVMPVLAHSVAEINQDLINDVGVLANEPLAQGWSIPLADVRPTP